MTIKLNLTGNKYWSGKYDEPVCETVGCNGEKLADIAKKFLERHPECFDCHLFNWEVEKSISKTFHRDEIIKTEAQDERMEIISD